MMENTIRGNNDFDYILGKLTIINKLFHEKDTNLFNECKAVAEGKKQSFDPEVLDILKQDDQYSKLLNNDTLTKEAIEEFLEFTPPHRTLGNNTPDPHRYSLRI